MGKASSVNVAIPEYSKGTVSLNGTNKATVSKTGNTINSNYDMNDYEKAVYDYAQQNLAQYLPGINTFSSDIRKDLNSQVEAYKNKAMQTLNDLYQPMIKNLTNNVASRFGNLDNSMFLDNLNSLENNRAKAISDLVQDIQSYKSNLYNNELMNRYNFINLLNSLITGSNTNALNYLSSALSNSASGNSYNATRFNQEMALANANNSNRQYLDALSGVSSLLNYL